MKKRTARILKLQALLNAMDNEQELSDEQKKLKDDVFRKHTDGWLDDDDKRILRES